MNGDTRTDGFTLRAAEFSDAALIYHFIREIATYEKLLHEVVCTEEDIRHVFFSAHPKVFCVLAFYEEKPVGYMVYFFNFSTFLCKHGIYLEDLFVLPEYRGKGFGKKLLIHLAQIAEANQCGRMEWAVLDWNAPSIEFYKSLGALPMDEWTVFRLGEKEISGLASRN